MVFAGTRQVYGKPEFLPVTEQHLVRPTDVNGINKVAGEYYHLVYNNVFGVRACSLRLTNIYGPRQLVKHNRQGFIGWFIRLAVEDREIQIFGDGSQLRDFVFVDDAADAFLRAGASDACNGEVFNVGGAEPISHRDLVHLLLEVAGTGTRPLRGVARGEEGDRHRQLLRRLQRSSRPPPAGSRASALREGLARTVAYYREHLRPLPATRVDAGTADRIMTALPRPVHAPGTRARTARPSTPPSGASSIADGTCSAPRSRPSSSAFAGACGAAHAIGVGHRAPTRSPSSCAALGIGPGDEVITTPVSAAYTALACMMVGARPVFADIDPRRLTIDPAAIEAAITPRTAAILPVHLYGQPADMRAIMAIADGARPRGRRRLLPGAPGDVRRPARSAASAWPPPTASIPTKNLGALGDGGAITTNDAALAAKMKRIRNGGQTDRYHHGEMGVNSRLDEMQAAILSRAPAAAARAGPRRGGRTPPRTGDCSPDAGIEVPPECDAGHVYHLFPVLSPRRDDLQAACGRTGIETLIHYPVPIPRQPALQTEAPAACPEADRVCARILSLPLYPGIAAEDLRTVAGAVGASPRSRMHPGAGQPHR